MDRLPALFKVHRKLRIVRPTVSTSQILPESGHDSRLENSQGRPGCWRGREIRLPMADQEAYRGTMRRLSRWSGSIRNRGAGGRPKVLVKVPVNYDAALRRARRGGKNANGIPG